MNETQHYKIFKQTNFIGIFLNNRDRPISTIRVSFLVEHPRLAMGKQPLDEPLRRSRYCNNGSAKLPGCRVDAEEPGLGNGHPADNELGNDSVVKSKI